MVRFGLNPHIIETINQVFQKHNHVEKVLLYGSRAIGNYRIGSDIDLTLIGDNLDLTTLQLIENELDELLLPYKFDISLYRQITNQDLIKHIEEFGKVFFSQKSSH
ncbi:nucleotidyltransferase domain-containing protein [Belliella sp. R4-6]|uniref:Nucleotidyltransferase domain-containing protein n=1 Tax=Belliella alkalica TaxID=1730871 RepID=A0ABS9V7H7_9BACT|nr:nucleotidyltransferase domain-containing protein [Belliella alkalica]MCH7412372.1 nucleotidyltransferase domain-containing protein [Belliella alkalica]